MIFNGDMLRVLPLLAPESIDSAVTDPPYHLVEMSKRFGKHKAIAAQHGKDGAFKRASRGFMGKEWDGGDIAFRPETWRAVGRAMKPGAYLVAFSSSRTYHHLATAIEDAGFVIKDQIMWLYGTGFPKSKGVLKPAHEPIVLARWGGKGVGSLRVEDCRVEAGNRHPANVMHDGSPEVLEHFPITKGAGAVSGKESSDLTRGIYGKFSERYASPSLESGSAARFFYSAKASNSERVWHCIECNAGAVSRRPDICPKCGADTAAHPTVKPQALMQYLCRLVTPPGGTVLDPFAGTGSTLQAAHDAGYGYVGIEADEKYFQDIKRRLAE